MKFEDLTRKMKKLGRDTVEEVQKMNEVRQFNSRINDAKKQVENTYAEIGRKFFDLNKDDAPEGFEEYVQVINEKLEQIEQLKEEVRRVKGVVLCENCNSEVPSTERFCSNCGNKMPEVFVIVEDEDEADCVLDADDVTEAVEDAAEDTVDTVEEAIDDVKEAAKEVAEDIADGVGKAVENISEIIEETTEE